MVVPLLAESGYGYVRQSRVAISLSIRITNMASAMMSLSGHLHSSRFPETICEYKDSQML